MSLSRQPLKEALSSARNLNNIGVAPIGEPDSNQYSMNNDERKDLVEQKIQEIAEMHDFLENMMPDEIHEGEVINSPQKVKYHQTNKKVLDIIRQVELMDDDFENPEWLIIISIK